MNPPIIPIALSETGYGRPTSFEYPMESSHCARTSSEEEEVYEITETYYRSPAGSTPAR